MTTRHARVTSPLGEMIIVSDNDAIVRIALAHQAHLGDESSFGERDDESSLEAQKQLAEYFAGKRTTFDLSLHAQGTAFQLEVWRALSQIPYGETRSYGEIAQAIGRPKAVRAVGVANSRNPHAVVVPCHRVIGANGSLVGYAGGLEAKVHLLELERAR